MSLLNIVCSLDLKQVGNEVLRMIRSVQTYNTNSEIQTGINVRYFMNG